MYDAEKMAMGEKDEKPKSRKVRIPPRALSDSQRITFSFSFI
jgi:hypothetical protein